METAVRRLPSPSAQIYMYSGDNDMLCQRSGGSCSLMSWTLWEPWLSVCSWMLHTESRASFSIPPLMNKRLIHQSWRAYLCTSWHLVGLVRSKREPWLTRVSTDIWLLSLKRCFSHTRPETTPLWRGRTLQRTFKQSLWYVTWCFCLHTTVRIKQVSFWSLQLIDTLYPSGNCSHPLTVSPYRK